MALLRIVSDRERFLRPVDGSTLGIFRILWGLLMCVETNWLHNQLHDLHRPDVLHFYFQGFSWIRHFPAAWMTEVEMTLMLFAAAMIAAGIAFRAAAVFFAAAYAHLLFSEAIAYNNHFYLIVLVTALLAFTRADERHSLRQWRRAQTGLAPDLIPVWNYYILRLQVVIVYFYGGIAKLNRDWLIEMEPVRFWLQNSPRPPELLAKILHQEWFVPVTAWGGLLIDLICPFLLLFKRTRVAAIVVLVLFHAINSQIFSIGLFPIIAIVLILPFLPPRLGRVKPPDPGSDAAISSVPPADRPSPAGNKAVFAVLVAHFVFQLLFPLRWHLWRPADPNWVEKGHRFAWRMMLREKIADFQIRFSDPEVKAWVEQRPGVMPRLSATARMKISGNPYFIRQYVQALRQNLATYGKGDAAIHVFATCSLNGRPYYPLIDPHIDLAKAEVPIHRVPDWILPLPDLRVDYEQIRPFERKFELSDEAIAKWIAANPGPATEILELYGQGRE